MTNKISYKKLMELSPTEYGRMTNSIGQEITLYEHPLQGDECDVLAVCHELELAFHSGFYDCDDMLDEERDDYHVYFINKEITFGYELYERLD